jgi:hypothetical protein
MPTYIIGQDAAEISLILAKGPSNTSKGVYSSYAWLSAWKNAGDFAEYNIDVKTPGLYEVSIYYLGAPNGALISARSGMSEISNTIETYDKAILGSLELQAGEGSFKLMLQDNPAGGEVFTKLERIELRKR